MPITYDFTGEAFIHGSSGLSTEHNFATMTKLRPYLRLPLIPFNRSTRARVGPSNYMERIFSGLANSMFTAFAQIIWFSDPT